MKIEDIFKVLEKENVRYTVVGGLAVVLYGYVRFTKDIDLVLEFSPDNISRFAHALELLHFEPGVPIDPLDLADPSKRETWAGEKNAQAITFYNKDAPMLQIDVLLAPLISGLKSLRRIIGDVEISIVSFEDLVKMKSESGREIDKLDVAKLKELRSP